MASSISRRNTSRSLEWKASRSSSARCSASHRSRSFASSVPSCTRTARRPPRPAPPPLPPRRARRRPAFSAAVLALSARASASALPARALVASSNSALRAFSSSSHRSRRCSVSSRSARLVVLRSRHSQRHRLLAAFGDGVEEARGDVGASLSAEVLRPELERVKHRRFVPQRLFELLLETAGLGRLHLEFIPGGFEFGSELRASRRGVGTARGHLMLEPAHVRLLRLQRGLQRVALGGHAFNLASQEVVLALLGLQRLLRLELLRDWEGRGVPTVRCFASRGPRGASRGPCERPRRDDAGVPGA